jgi:hypothetical protein
LPFSCLWCRRDFLFDKPATVVAFGAVVDQEDVLAKKNALSGSALLPTVAEPGTHEWCEEVVECMNAAWRTRETSEQAFLAAVRAAAEYSIWETLSPPPPDEPLVSLDGLIRRTAEPGQAENMQIAIRFSGVLQHAPAPNTPGGEPPWSVDAVPVAASARGQMSVAAPGYAPAHPLSEEEEIAAGNALLDQYGAGLTAVLADPSASGGPEVGLASVAPLPVSPRRTAAQRKRDRLERDHPELADAVQAGELTLKQAFVQAGIEKEVRNLDKLQKLWRAASPEERDHFLSWVDAEEGLEQRRAYERAVYGENE